MTTTILTDEQIESALISAGHVRADFKLTPQALANSRAIEQAVLQSPEVEARQWQPIETAPKDFVTEFDGWNGGRVPNVIWAHPEYEAKGEYAWCRAFYEHNHGWTMERVRGLTHWMPLPPPPQP